MTDSQPGPKTDVAHWPVHGRRLIFGDKRLLMEKANRRDDLRVSPDGFDGGVFRDGDDVVIRSTSEEKPLSLSGLLMLPGDHNRDNAIAAICAAAAIGVSSDAIRSGLCDFQPLPHRLQWVSEIDGRKFYNDSLATTPQSVRAALDSFCEPVVLLAGGYDKQIDLTELARTICGGVKAVALMGQTAEVLQLLIDGSSVADSLDVRQCESFEESFRWACDRSSPGDVVLLSPGCASYDWFRNFAERGERFIELVKQLEETGGLTPAARAVFRK